MATARHGYAANESHRLAAFWLLLIWLGILAIREEGE
jgi:hypothetical protein